MQIVITQKMSFARPTTTPKHYLAAGASGWIETFLRADADRDLEKFVSPRPVRDMAINFIDSCEAQIEKKQTKWPDILSYISRILRIHPDKIPVAVGVAFWARVTMIEDEKLDGGN